MQGTLDCVRVGTKAAQHISFHVYQIDALRLSAVGPALAFRTSLRFPVYEIQALVLPDSHLGYDSRLCRTYPVRYCFPQALNQNGTLVRTLNLQYRMSLLESIKELTHIT